MRRLFRSIGESKKSRTDRITCDEGRYMPACAESDLPKTFDNTLHEQIRKLIEGLPKDLQTSSGSASTKGLSSELCDLHQVLNHDLVHGISRLVRREITSHFRQLDAYPQLVEPVEETILQRLRALRVYWSKPSEDNVATADAQPSQFNQCPACILATIAGNKDILCNLRVVVHSRTRTRRNQHPRKLTLFIDHCINRFSPAEADDVRRTSDQLALGMKRARKACVKAYLRDCQIDPSATSRMKRHRRRRRRRHRHQDHDSRKRVSGEEHRAESEMSLDSLKSPSTPLTTQMDDLDVRSSPGSDSASSCSWWSDSNDGRLRRSYAPSPEHPNPNHADAQLPRGFSGEGRRSMNVRSNITLYQQLAHENPYSQTASFPDARKSPLCSTGDARSARSSVLSSMQAVQGSNSEGSMLKDSAGDWDDDDCQSKMSF